MKKYAKQVLLITFMLSLVVVLQGCGNNNRTNGNTTTGNGAGTQNGSTQTMEGTSNNEENNGVGGENANGNTNNTNNVNNANNNTGNNGSNADNGASGILEGAADVVDDVADGVGDALDNIGGGSFDNYEDAKEYLLNKLSRDNASANYEIRNEKKDLISYHSTDSKAEGYHFDVYETDGNEKIGTYYVDKDSGKIYRYMGKNSIEAY